MSQYGSRRIIRISNGGYTIPKKKLKRMVREDRGVPENEHYIFINIHQDVRRIRTGNCWWNYNYEDKVIPIKTFKELWEKFEEVNKHTEELFYMPIDAVVLTDDNPSLVKEILSKTGMNVYREYRDADGIVRYKQYKMLQLLKQVERG